MNEFVTFDVVSAEINPVASLFALQPMGSTSISPRSVRASEVRSYESVPSHEHPGSPHTRLTLSSGEVVYVKQHVTTVTERLSPLKMNEHKIEAIANADAHTSNAVLPTYTELVKALRDAVKLLEQHEHHNIVHSGALGRAQDMLGKLKEVAQ